MRRSVVIASALIAVSVPAVSAQQARPITLAEALELATRNQPTMVTARQDVRVADAQERQRLAAFLPSLSLSTSTSKSAATRLDQTTGTLRAVPSLYSNSLGLSTSWDLFTGFRRGADRTAARATTDQREAALLRTQYATVLATQQAFYTALANAELVGVQETRLRRADEQLKLTSERLRLGATTRSDSLRARVEYGNAQLALITAQNNLRNAQAALARQVQVEGLVTPAPDSTLFIRLQPLDTALLMREALAGAPAVREAEAAVTTARANRNASRSTYFPSVTFTAGYNYVGSDDMPLSGSYRPTWNFRVGASLPLFNNLSRETSIITADATVQQNVARARDARLQVSTTLTQYVAALDAAAARIDVSTVSVAAAEEDLRMQRERYRLGAATILEVLTSQATLDQAQVDLVQARYDYLVARAQIEAVVGHAL